ncbi:hypothetical protein B0A49_03724 [Cryomyces minteri]|uniref:DUF7371 domain-containing protein n=1 Tax=Cryomyces minteri TaxID=331657 RepID=A0A4U0XGP0_9PEZI|nr:hypothetical protein B0A49_03724 [Cryomyces minteri]
MRFIVALTACALAGVALTQDTGTSTCEISTIYVPVPGPTATVTVSSVEASPQAESFASITTTNTALFTYTNFVTVAPSGSASEYYFSASKGTTTWLNGNAPPAYGSYVVGTTSVIVMPTPTITIVVTETATASATLSDSSSVVFAIGSANSDVTTTLHATSFVTLVQTSVNTLTMTHSPSSSFGPTYSGIGTSGWNMTSETMGTTTLTAAPVTLTEELQSAATSPAEVNSTLHLTATVRIPVTIKQSAISSALANATIATSTTSAPSTTETFDLSSALSSLHAGDASSFLSSLALASATKYGATAPTAAPPVFNPYHHLYYANGFSYVPPPTVPFPPSSPPRLAMYLSNDTGDIGSPNAGGMKAGELGAGPRGATDAYWIDAWSVYLGCDNEGPTDCTMVLSGYRWDTATGQETLHVQQNATLSPCPGYIDCHLQHVVLDSGFTSLTGFQIQAFVNETVDRTYFMDDLAMGWSNNTCAAGLLRISSRK